jgi:endo-1,3-1,4-beta-glycanase ExoK
MLPDDHSFRDALLELKEATCRLKHIVATGLFVTLCLGQAHAADIPLFNPYPKLNQQTWYISHGWANGKIQSCEWRKESLTVNDKNLVIEISNKGGNVHTVSCGEIHTKEPTGYGSYAIRMKAAKGSGLNSAFFTYIGPPTGSPHHDEIDFEFLGKDTTKVQLNHYIDGKQQYSGKDAVFIDLGFDASEEFHDYTFVWEPNKIRWFIDDRQVHETADGVAIPSHPGRIYLTLWSGSDSVNGWLGPFKYEHDVRAEFSWVKFTPINN